MPSGKGQPSPAPSKRLNVSRTVEAAMPSRRAISRVEIPAENFKRMISRTWRIATLSAGIIAPLDCQRRDLKQASGGARRDCRRRAALFRAGGRHHLVMVGGIIPLRRATSSRYDGRLEQESARRPKIPELPRRKTRNYGCKCGRISCRSRPPGTEFLDAETGRQKPPPKRLSAHRDQSPRSKWPEIPGETPYFASYRNRAVCGDWIVVCAVSYGPGSKSKIPQPGKKQEK